MLKKIVSFFVPLIVFPLAVNAATIQLPKTGQTICYNAAGAPVACAGTGQDAEKQTGVAWPAPRFVDGANGTVTDNLTGLVWLKDAGCFAAQNWTAALASANGLANGRCGLADNSSTGQWRLPNVVELQSLYDLSKEEAFDETGLFTNVDASYWSSTTHPRYFGNAWVGMFDGRVLSDNKAGIHFVWPVRNAQ